MSVSLKMKAAVGVMVVGTALTVGGCINKPDVTDPAEAIFSKIPESFSFRSDKDVTFKVTALTNRNNPLKGVPFSVYSLPDSALLFSGVTSNTGVFDVSYRLGNHIQQVEVRTTYPGIPNSQVVSLKGNTISATFGGSAPTGRINAETGVTASITNTRIPNLKTLGTWSNNGFPSYLVSNTPDAIEQAFYDRVTASLPEKVDLATSHPEYLANKAPATLKVTEMADVWVTFVTEGAGWMNSLGFYKFTNAPTSVNDLIDPTIIFPNVSMVGSGGSLVSGHKVYLGRFPANTNIGFFLLANPFNATNGTIGQGNYVHFSHTDLNPESTPKRHFVVLNDSATDRILLAVEDVSLDNVPQVSDRDYNDAVFYVTSNPVKAIERTDIPTTDVPKDTDGDGIPDPRDEYPNDKDRAFNKYTPGKDQFSTLAYEDQWPSKGDYDFNDLVLNYNVQEVLNANEDVVDVKTRMKVAAIGASFKNGWGVQLPVLPSAIKSASTTDKATNVKTTLTTEANQTYATIVAFQNMTDKIGKSTSTMGMVNTEKGVPYVNPTEFTLDISFNTPVAQSVLGSAPYNTFLVVNGERGRELHLANYLPTNKINAGLFGTRDDRTNPNTNKYFKDNNNMPWVLNLPVVFEYPFERTSILSTYTHFFEWATSGGSKYGDWYKNNTGYRKATSVYTKQ